jgi:hypothetical protein
MNACPAVSRERGGTTAIAAANDDRGQSASPHQLALAPSRQHPLPDAGSSFIRARVTRPLVTNSNLDTQNSPKMIVR